MNDSVDCVNTNGTFVHHTNGAHSIDSKVSNEFKETNGNGTHETDSEL